MNIPEARDLLVLLSAVDGRQVTDENAAVWAALLEQVRADDATEAVKQLLRDPTAPHRIDPGHVLERAGEVKRKRIGVERAAMPKRKPQTMAEIMAEDAARRAARGLPNALVTPQGVQYVESPYREWEAGRKAASEALKRAQRPVLDDINLIEQIEANRTRYLAALRNMMGDGDGPATVAQAEAEEDPGGDQV